MADAASRQRRVTNLSQVSPEAKRARRSTQSLFQRPPASGAPVNPVSSRSRDHGLETAQPESRQSRPSRVTGPPPARPSTMNSLDRRGLEALVEEAANIYHGKYGASSDARILQDSSIPSSCYVPIPGSSAPDRPVRVQQFANVRLLESSWSARQRQTAPSPYSNSPLAEAAVLNGSGQNLVQSTDAGAAPAPTSTLVIDLTLDSSDSEPGPDLDLPDYCSDDEPLLSWNAPLSGNVVQTPLAPCLGSSKVQRSIHHSPMNSIEGRRDARIVDSVPVSLTSLIPESSRRRAVSRTSLLSESSRRRAANPSSDVRKRDSSAGTDMPHFRVRRPARKYSDLLQPWQKSGREESARALLKEIDIFDISRLPAGVWEEMRLMLPSDQKKCVEKLHAQRSGFDVADEQRDDSLFSTATIPAAGACPSEAGVITPSNGATPATEELESLATRNHIGARGRPRGDEQETEAPQGGGYRKRSRKAHAASQASRTPHSSEPEKSQPKRRRFITPPFIESSPTPPRSQINSTRGNTAGSSTHVQSAAECAPPQRKRSRGRSEDGTGSASSGASPCAFEDQDLEEIVVVPQNFEKAARLMESDAARETWVSPRGQRALLATTPACMPLRDGETSEESETPSISEDDASPAPTRGSSCLNASDAEQTTEKPASPRVSARAFAAAPTRCSPSPEGPTAEASAEERAASSVSEYDVAAVRASRSSYGEFPDVKKAGEELASHGVSETEFSARMARLSIPRKDSDKEGTSRDPVSPSVSLTDVSANIARRNPPHTTANASLGEASEPHENSLAERLRQMALQRFDSDVLDAAIYRQPESHLPASLNIPFNALRTEIPTRVPIRSLPRSSLSFAQRMHRPLWPEEQEVKDAEIAARGGRKHWYQRAVARKEWRWAADAKIPEHQRPRVAAHSRDMSYMREEDLPQLVRDNPAWLEFWRWHRGRGRTI